MQNRRGLPSILLSIACFALLSIFCASIASHAASTAIAPPTREPKCTIDLADGKGSDCTLAKANHEWILWSNSAPKLRSIHFKPDENPFTEKNCWEVEPGARARSGPIALQAAAKVYIAYTSDVPCAANPPSNPNRGTLRVAVQ
ncbi:MAG TPA: hypothetical protein VNV84_00785 [Candidatus Acidoferrales bacterium]|jgi:hypothetical protein|nr:hypothetical protein [Candidatus Acidoferrales bacterium]